MSYLQALDGLEQKRKAEEEELKNLRIRVKELEAKLPATKSPVFTGWMLFKEDAPIIEMLSVKKEAIIKRFTDETQEDILQRIYDNCPSDILNYKPCNPDALWFVATQSGFSVRPVTIHLAQSPTEKEEV